MPTLAEAARHRRDGEGIHAPTFALVPIGQILTMLDQRRLAGRVTPCASSAKQISPRIANKKPTEASSKPGELEKGWWSQGGSNS